MTQGDKGTVWRMEGMIKYLNSVFFFQGHVVFDAQGSRMAWTLIEQLQGMPQRPPLL